MQIQDFIWNKWLGLNTRIKDLKDLGNFADDSLNFLTGPQNDHIELRMGTSLLGKTRVLGNGKITGMAIGISNSNLQTPYFSYARKIKYYSATDGDTHEVSTDLLPVGANGEDIAFSAYSNLAGAWMYWSSQHSSIYKINLANLGTYIDMAADFHGYMNINFSRMFQWNTFNPTQNVTDKNNLLQSYADKTTYQSYTNIAAEVVGSGNGVTKTFAHTLAQTPGADHQTAFAVSATDGTENFSDNGDGGLIGTLGGTGTINYITGALSVTFNTAPGVGVNNITTSYFYEAKTASIVDFSFANPRVAGTGKIYPEYGGGDLQNSFPFNGNLYNLHSVKAWSLNIPSDDTLANDSIYRQGVGIPYWRAGYPVDEGIIYLDNVRKNEPMIRMLTLQQYSTNTVPDPISNNLDLTKNGFDFPVAHSFGNYYMMSCQAMHNGTNDPSNDICYIYNKIAGKEMWDKLDVGATCFANYLGLLLYGDPISNNVWELFSGYDDDGAVINNFWQSGAIGGDVDGLWRANRFLIDGYINPSQNFDIMAAFDNGNFVTIGNISGQGTYVDNAQGVLIGSDTIGLQVVGSGSSVNAYHFRYEFVITNSPNLYEYVVVKFVANDVGALQINEFRLRDRRYKGRRTIPAYEQTP